MTLIFVGAIIAVFGTFLAAYGTFEQNKSSSKKSAIQLQKLEHLTAKNEELSRQLSATTEEIKKNITGGDNYPKFLLRYHNNTTSILTLVNSHNSPIYDVSCRILDMDGIDKVDRNLGIPVGSKQRRKNGDQYSVYEFYGELGTLAPESGKDMTLIPFSLTGQLRRFTGYLYCRNGLFVQQQIYTKVDQKWVYAYRIFRQMHEDKILGSHTDTEFPADKLHWW